jgi:hypothetical protein
MAVSNATAIPLHLSQDVTGGYPLHVPEIPNAEPTNCMESIVAWLRNDETPLVLKAGTVFTVVIATIATGIATGYPLLVAAIVLVPTTIWAAIAWHQLSSKENAAQEASINAQRITAQIASRANAAQQAFRAIKEAVGGEAAFNALPVLDLGQHTGSTGYLDFLRPNDLTHSIMRGADAGGRPFISLKLNTPSDPGHPPHQTAITFFQRFATGGEWTWGSSSYHGDPVRFGDRLTPEDLATIRQIVVERNHPRLSLV